MALASLLVVPLAACEVPDPGPADVFVPGADPLAGLHLAGAELHYGPAVPQVLDVWLPDATTTRRRPALVWIHGGAWTSSTRDALGPSAGYVTELARRLDAAVVTVDFHRAPEAARPAEPSTAPSPARRDALVAPGPVPLTTLVADLTTALAWLRANAAGLGIDGDRLVLMGDSSGGHLAGLVAAAGAGFSARVPTNPRTGRGAPGVRAVVSLAGPTDLARLAASGLDVFGTPVASLVAGVLGCLPAECPPGVVEAADPLTWAGPATPPTWIVVGALDALVPPIHGQRWHQRLVAVRGTDQVDALDVVDTGPPEHQGHGGLQQGMNLTLLEAWLRERLR